MYVSRPVRKIRDDPIPGESVTLLLRLADDVDAGTVARAVRDRGGEVEEELQFGNLQVTVAHAAVTDICDLDGIRAVETDNVLTMDLDGAGEDVCNFGATSREFI